MPKNNTKTPSSSSSSSSSSTSTSSSLMEKQTIMSRLGSFGKPIVVLSVTVALVSLLAGATPSGSAFLKALIDRTLVAAALLTSATWGMLEYAGALAGNGAAVVVDNVEKVTGKGSVATAVEAAKGVVKTIDAVTGITDKASAAASAAGSAIAGAAGKAVDVVSGAGHAVADVVSGAGAAVAGMASKAGSAIAGGASSAVRWVSGLFG